MKRLMGEETKTSKSDFVDLGEYEVSVKDEPASCLVKVAEISKYEDVADLAEQVYGGHILVIDIRNVAKDEFQLRRVTTELRKVATDVGGDVAGIAEGLLCVTPAGIKVDRQKIRVSA